MNVGVARCVLVSVGSTVTDPVVTVNVTVGVGTNVLVGVASHVADALCQVRLSVSGGDGVGGGVSDSLSVVVGVDTVRIGLTVSVSLSDREPVWLESARQLT